MVNGQCVTQAITCKCRPRQVRGPFRMGECWEMGMLVPVGSAEMN